jgi:hypothetical protein
MMAMDEWEWLGRLASELGEQPPGREEIGTMLRLSREVARGVERKLAPLTTFVAGMHVARRASEGVGRADALREVEAAVTALVPEGAGMDDQRRGRGGGGGRRRFRRFGRRRTR